MEKLIFPEDSMPSFTNDLVTKICTHLDLALQKKPALENACTAMAIMVNNLGAVPISEMLIVRKAVSNFLFSRHAQVLNGEIYRFHMFEGAFMTSLQMVGISISCFMMSEGANNMEQLLHAKTDVTAWNRGFPLLPPHERKVLPFSIALESGLHEEDNNVARSELSSETKATITAITTALLHVAEDLASLDRITGDGDMGDTGVFLSSSLLDLFRSVCRE